MNRQTLLKTLPSLAVGKKLFQVVLNVVGSITTSWSLRTLVAVLVNNPHIQRALQEEADHVMLDDLPRIKYRQHMPYTDAVKYFLSSQRSI